MHFEFESVHVCEPYTGLFNRDVAIYMLVCMSVCQYVGLSTKNMYAKMHAQNYMVQIHACSK